MGLVQRAVHAVMDYSQSMQREGYCLAQVSANLLGICSLRVSIRYGITEHLGFGEQRTLLQKVVKYANTLTTAMERAHYTGMFMALTRSRSFGLRRVDLVRRLMKHD
jgi:hypothetical protein